jgi:hypothetical protein
VVLEVTAMKVESRGKYAGVKVHLDANEAESLIKAASNLSDPKFYQADLISVAVPLKLAKKMGEQIKDLLKENPDLLKERTPEQVAAILAKESEKAGLQLNALKNGKDWKKIDPAKLEKALLHHVK